MNLSNNDMNKMIKTSTSSFEDMRKEDTLYVDKTSYLYKLIIQEGEYFFLSRPRRFGKSLTISTLEALFEGRKELFDGLYISQTDYDFKKHPIIHLDFGEYQKKTAKEIEKWIKNRIDDTAEEYNVILKKGRGYAENFSELIKKLNEKFDKVVVLIDEYDKPLSDSVDNIQNALEIRDVLRSFFEVLKASASYLRFVFITGVTKYSKVSIFSSMNNLNDLSTDDEFATMLGYTQEELEHYFAEGINEGSKTLNLSREEYLCKVKGWYDGYRFASESETVYNPVSVGRFFKKGGKKFDPFWVETGGSSKLVYDVARRVDFNIITDLNEPLSMNMITSYDITELVGKNTNVEFLKSLLLQTGYLTIKETLGNNGQMFLLDFPNREVRESFLTNLAGMYLGKDTGISLTPDYLIEFFQHGETEKAIEKIKGIFASASYNVTKKLNEAAFEMAIYTMLRAMGAEFDIEVPTNQGRIDSVLKTPQHIYVIEYKVGKSADEALQQIKDKGYAEQFLAHKQDGVKIHLVGINFSTALLNISDVKEEII